MFYRSKNRVLAGLVVVGVVAGSSLLAAAPANAAPGDASAEGASAVVGLDIPVIGFDAEAVVGSVAVTGSGTESFDEDGVTLLDLAFADITLGAVTTSATSDPTGSEGSAVISDGAVSVLGLDVLTLGEATALATCPTVGTPTATAEVTGLTLLGDAATVDAGDPAAEATVALGVVGGVDLTGVDLTVTVTQIETVTATGGLAVSLLGVVTLDGTAGALTFDNEAVATVALASAACEAPAVVAVTATAIDPAVGPTTGGQTVTITGSGFTSTTVVDFGGSPATGIVVNADGTSLTAVTPAGAEGPTIVTVSNPGSAATLAYEYVEPAVASFTPTSGPEYGGTVVTITGTGLGTTTDVEFGGVAADILSINPDGTSVVVSTPAGDGAVDVTLTLAGGETVTATDEFVYVAPSVSTVSPRQGAAAGGTTVTITGAGLGGTTGVLFGGTAGTIVGTPTDTEVVVTTPAGAAGLVDVTVEIPGDDIVLADAFEYVAAPVVEDASPRSGSRLGGTVVTVDGTGFVPGATTVAICGIVIPASEVTVNDGGTQLRFSTPACDPGETEFVVTTVGGASEPVSFRYLDSATAVDRSSDRPLADTGSTPTPLVGWGVLLLLTGLMAVCIAAVRRRAA